MSKELEKNYNPSEIEERLYQKWLDKKYFHAEVNRDKKPFTIVMPPPNITGKLHMGHALDNTMQDILIRFKRMQGYEALWVPGTDHASISTEVKVTNALKDEGIDKHELGREGFLKRTWEWKKEYGGTITSQLRKIGSSCDWDRERFTMDEGCSKAVQEVFIKLYEKGLIYKGSRIVNWCPVCNTSISDAEVEHEEQAGHFWHINYPVVGEEGRFVEIATTRPETLLGDSALAVNPNDDRYKDLVGKMVELPLTDRQIPIIADEYVDMEFGTGVVKITPAHDPNDFEVGKRHNLPEINILNDDATINNLGGKYAGMDRYEARKAMVADLDAQGLLVRVEDHVHNVGTHDRCKTTVEPMIKQQWFVKMDELIKPAVEGVKNGDIELMPAYMDKTYFNWKDKGEFPRRNFPPMRPVPFDKSRSGIIICNTKPISPGEEGPFMNLELSKKQFRRLLDMAYIGNWILNSTRGDQRFKDYDEVESLLFGKAAAEGMPALAELYQGEVVPSRAFVEGGIHAAIMEYENNVFFDILAEDLARRDMDDAPIDESNYDELTSRIDAYIAEFEEHGTDNILVDIDT